MGFAVPFLLLLRVQLGEIVESDACTDQTKTYFRKKLSSFNKAYRAITDGFSNKAREM
jgi:hypothetical protein